VTIGLYLVTFVALSAIILVFSISIRVPVFNVAMGQAVPLIPLSSGNVTLDNGIPKFYKCIQKEIKSSLNANDDPYFKSEPTKEEVFKCYKSVFTHSDSELNGVK
jgi:hypothetical protein